MKKKFKSYFFGILTAGVLLAGSLIALGADPDICGQSADNCSAAACATQHSTKVWLAGYECCEQQGPLTGNQCVTEEPIGS